MRLRDAIDMLADSGVGALVPTIWADLGCGDGTFTLALADLLAPGSMIHAMISTARRFEKFLLHGELRRMVGLLAASRGQ
jgi:hypothetical protein